MQRAKAKGIFSIQKNRFVQSSVCVVSESYMFCSSTLNRTIPIKAVSRSHCPNEQLQKDFRDPSQKAMLCSHRNDVKLCHPELRVAQSIFETDLSLGPQRRHWEGMVMQCDAGCDAMWCNVMQVQVIQVPSANWSTSGRGHRSLCHGGWGNRRLVWTGRWKAGERQVRRGSRICLENICGTMWAQVCRTTCRVLETNDPAVDAPVIRLTTHDC